MSETRTKTAPEIMVAPTGARRSKAAHPALPITLDEIAETASACAAAGAQAFHLHIRDAEGRHSLDAGRYREAMTAVADAAPSLTLQITTEGAGVFSVDEQLACLQAVRPPWASLALREIGDDQADAVYGCCAEANIRVQHIVFDADDFACLRARQARGVVRPAQSEIIFVLGAYADQRAGRAEELDALLAGAPEGLSWSVCNFGRTEQANLLNAARAGAGCLRIGFENNLERPDGEPWRDNAESVAALVAALAEARAP